MSRLQGLQTFLKFLLGGGSCGGARRMLRAVRCALRAGVGAGRVRGGPPGSQRPPGLALVDWLGWALEGFWLPGARTQESLFLPGHKKKFRQFCFVSGGLEGPGKGKNGPKRIPRRSKVAKSCPKWVRIQAPEI